MTQPTSQQQVILDVLGGRAEGLTAHELWMATGHVYLGDGGSRRWQADTELLIACGLVVFHGNFFTRDSGDHGTKHLVAPAPTGLVDLPDCCECEEGAGLAETLYVAYNLAGAHPGLNYAGQPCPRWHDLPVDVRHKWEAVAEHVTDTLEEWKAQEIAWSRKLKISRIRTAIEQLEDAIRDAREDASGHEAQGVDIAPPHVEGEQP